MSRGRPSNPDLFYETCLTGWGAVGLSDFDDGLLAGYRRCWRDADRIHGSCSDCRAAAAVDLAQDEADIKRNVECPTLALCGCNGVMHGLFEMEAAWRERCRDLASATLPDGHILVGQFPEQTAGILLNFPNGLQSETSQR